MLKDDRPPLALQLVFLGKILDHQIEHRLAGHGLNRTQTVILMALSRHEGLKVLDFCAHARVEPANVTRTLQSLERLELAERRPHPTDGRVSLFYSTKAGRSLATLLQTEVAQISADILGNLKGTDLVSLETGLAALWRTLPRRQEESGEDRTGLPLWHPARSRGSDVEHQ
jgi:DNA-binding MarR family transcriptional regulator